LEVTTLSEVQAQVQVQSQSHARRFTLNSDGKRHPRVNAAAAYSVVAGLISFVMGLVSANHIVGAALGVSAFLVGLGAQMESSTTEQRSVIVFGVVAAFVGMGLAIAHGGFG
jgi:hypothetical protein